MGQVISLALPGYAGEVIEWRGAPLGSVAILGVLALNGILICNSMIDRRRSPVWR